MSEIYLINDLCGRTKSTTKQLSLLNARSHGQLPYEKVGDVVGKYESNLEDQSRRVSSFV